MPRVTSGGRRCDAILRSYPDDEPRWNVCHGRGGALLEPGKEHPMAANSNANSNADANSNGNADFNANADTFTYSDYL